MEEKNKVGNVFGNYIYDLPNSFIKKGIQITRIDENFEFTPKPHRHLFYELFILVEGECTQTIDFSTHQVKQHHIYCIRPGQIHEIKPTTTCYGYFIMFHEELFVKYAPQCIAGELKGFNYNQHDPHIPVSTDMMVYTENLLKYQHRTSQKKYSIMASLLTTLLFEIEYHIDTQTRSDNGQTEWVHKFFNYIHQQGTPITSVQEIADSLHLNSNYLNKVIKEQTGFSASHWIIQKRLNEAKRLLLFSTLSIKDISTYLGFKESAHFSRFFKTNETTSPSVWQRTHKENTSC